MTDVPITEFTRKKIFAPALCGAKLLAPTIERLLPATYMAVTKSVGVSWLLFVIVVPSCGCTISAAPIARNIDQVSSNATTIKGPQNDNRRPLRGLDPRLPRRVSQTSLASRLLMIPVP